MTQHFIADAHLTGDDDLSAQRMRYYCRGPGRAADAVYLLGDLFDVWIGDDGSLPKHRRTVEAIGALAATGTMVYFMRGNRDFAVGDEFVATSGVTMLDDPCTTIVGGIPTLLTHGDLLCTNDAAQQRFRARYSNPRWRARMLRLPLVVRHLAARSARRHSKRRHRGCYRQELDVSAQSIARLTRETGTKRLIHGHTHRPTDDRLGNVDRRVLADWRVDYAEYLVVDDASITRQNLD